MPTVREIEQALFRLAPKEGAMDWDNVGQLLGDPERGGPAGPGGPGHHGGRGGRGHRRKAAS